MFRQVGKLEAYIVSCVQFCRAANRCRSISTPQTLTSKNVNNILGLLKWESVVLYLVKKHRMTISTSKYSVLLLPDTKLWMHEFLVKTVLTETQKLTK